MSNDQPNHTNRRAAIYRLSGALAAGLFLVLILLGHPFAVSSDNALFAPVSAALALDGDNAAARRARPVGINWDALNPSADEIRLNLFDDVSLTAVHRRTDLSVTGGYVWVGDIVGDAGGTATLSVQDGVLSGSVYRFGSEWAKISLAPNAPGDLYTILEVDPFAPEPTGVDFVIPEPPEFEMQTISPQGAVCLEDGSVITVMVVYTAAARDAVGGQAAMEALVNQRISEMNTANDASVVFFDWKLINVQEVGYSESGNIYSDLQYLQDPDDGKLDDVHPLRDAHLADLVAMIISEGSNGACGYAYQMSSLGDYFKDSAFGVSALEYPGPNICSSLTLAHELGHNLGDAHNRAHATGSVLFPYSYGYQSPNQTFRDIMSYDCPNGCPRINQWSNPDVWYAGEPTGVDFETDPPHAADLARSMNESRVLVSNFRADCVDPTATPTGTPTDIPPPTDTPAPSITPTETLIPTDTATPTATLIPSETPTPTVTPTGTLPTPTRTPRPTATSRPTRTPRPSPTAEPIEPLPNSLYLPALLGET
jgi:hypothetical protein